jgi:hypothetical protein
VEFLVLVADFGEMFRKNFILPFDGIFGIGIKKQRICQIIDSGYNKTENQKEYNPPECALYAFADVLESQSFGIELEF